ncbi:YeeE/YedE thiosulfate transporter family protein [Tolumonas lignilytica]|uniref:YeeE/YedE family protein n=1 Tax=Tolumonas lignilytica TaxID=1283284 RepID=UPI0004B155C9
MHNFTPWSALGGGLLIGLAALLLLLGKGRIAGYSGIIAGFLFAGAQRWQALFLVGTVAGACIAVYLLHLHISQLQFSPSLIIAGLLVGLGSRLANGCTSGHGICGIGRFSIRSIVATVLFMISGMVMVAFFH